MSFCPKCGKEVAEGIAFCTSCGNKMSEDAPVTQSGSKKLHCPNCKSHNLTVTTESSVGSAISTGRTVRTTMVSNTHRNYWVCSDCGTKFRNIQNLEEEIKKNKNAPKLCAVFAIIAAIFFLITLVQSMSNPFMGMMLMSSLVIEVVITVVCIIYVFVYKNKNVKMKEELAYLKENCFN